MNIWIGDFNDDKIYKYDMSGNYINSFNPVSQYVQGLTTDGNHIWYSDHGTQEVYKFEMDGTYTTEHWDLSGEVARPEGLAYDGINFFVFDNTLRDVFVYEGAVSPPSDPVLLFGAGFNFSAPYVELQWTHDLVDVDFFEVQNSSDKISWDYLGQSETAAYIDLEVLNGTERYYRVKACKQLGETWFNSSYTDVNFETVYFISDTEGDGEEIIVESDAPWIAIAIILSIIAFLLATGIKR